MNFPDFKTFLEVNSDSEQKRLNELFGHIRISNIEMKYEKSGRAVVIVPVERNFSTLTGLYIYNAGDKNIRLTSANLFKNDGILTPLQCTGIVSTEEFKSFKKGDCKLPHNLLSNVLSNECFYNIRLVLEFDFAEANPIIYIYKDDEIVRKYSGNMLDCSLIMEGVCLTEKNQKLL